MADVKFPNISQNNNSSFIEGRQQPSASQNRRGLVGGEYDDSSGFAGQGRDERAQSFQSNRVNSVGPARNKGITDAKKQRKE